MSFTGCCWMNEMKKAYKYQLTVHVTDHWEILPSSLAEECAVLQVLRGRSDGCPRKGREVLPRKWHFCLILGISVVLCSIIYAANVYTALICRLCQILEISDEQNRQDPGFCRDYHPGRGKETDTVVLRREAEMGGWDGDLRLSAVFGEWDSTS